MLDSGPTIPWYENATLSTKPEVHNISQRRQRRTELRPYRQGNMHKIGEIRSCAFGFELCERTDRRTYILVTILCTPSGAKCLTIARPDCAPTPVVVSGYSSHQLQSSHTLFTKTTSRKPVLDWRAEREREMADSGHSVHCSSYSRAASRPIRQTRMYSATTFVYSLRRAVRLNFSWLEFSRITFVKLQTLSADFFLQNFDRGTEITA